VAEIESLRPVAIVISPGPCTPSEAGISMELIRELGPRVPILGVCLGHQAIAQALGGRLVRAPEPVHGRTSLVHHTGTRLFANLPNPLTATRYHSLIVEEASLPAELRVVARTARSDAHAVLPRSQAPLRTGQTKDDFDRLPLPPNGESKAGSTSDLATFAGIPMALEHESWPLFGVQFHPESVLTESGHRLLANFLRLAGLPVGQVPPGDTAAIHPAPSADDAWWRAAPL
jgi:anthranilate/para-aminobenzoate synthase component II